MPTLDWIGKKAVVKHHLEVPYRLLRCEGGLSAGEPGQGNLLIQGDNLEALKALLPYYGGKVKCIYIDPPYNTGNEGWVYNDNVNSPEIRQWLGKVVGREAEDLSRHDKWLCMMYPRLSLLKSFLCNDGAIFITVDDNEAYNLKLICDEIFGPRNYFGTIIWQHSVQGKNDAKTISLHHNYLIVYQKSDFFARNMLPRLDRHNVHYGNPDNDPNGPWRSGDVRSPNLRENLKYTVVTPSGKKIRPPTKGWRWSKELFNEKVRTGEISFIDNETRVLRKIYLSEQDGRVPESIWFGEDAGTSREATAELSALVPDAPVFATPKPVRLIHQILQMASNPGDLILDSFAGSGTTGHAIFKINKEVGGNRRFILVEMDERVARDIAAKRLEQAIKGNKEIDGLGGGFRFCTLGQTLFNERGEIREEVKFPDLAHHVYFTETGEPMPKRPDKKTPLLGVHNGRAIYLLFNGVLDDKKPKGGNVLTQETLSLLPRHDGPKVVYGTACRLGAARLRRESVTFRQIPYEIKVK